MTRDAWTRASVHARTDIHTFHSRGNVCAINFSARPGSSDVRGPRKAWKRGEEGEVSSAGLGGGMGKACNLSARKIRSGAPGAPPSIGKAPDPTSPEPLPLT